jgi:hypothetical protein
MENLEYFCYPLPRLQIGIGEDYLGGIENTVSKQ